MKSGRSSVRPTHWLWHGILKTGRITLWAGDAHTEKSNLLVGLLRQLHSHRKFLGRATRSARARIVCTNPPVFWRIHNHDAPLGDHILIEWVGAKPRPTLPEWIGQVEEMIEQRNKGLFDLFVVGPIDRRFPAGWREHAEDVFAPLQRLARAGAAVLLILDDEHAGKPSRSAGGGDLLSRVDYAFQLGNFGRYTKARSDLQLVRLKGPSIAPARIPYRYDGKASFTVVDDPETVRFEAFWNVLEPILAACREPLDLNAIRDRWPASEKCPIASRMAVLLARATAEKRVRRLGNGRRNDPYRYQLAS